MPTSSSTRSSWNPNVFYQGLNGSEWTQYSVSKFIMQYIPYQSDEHTFFIRKIRRNFDAVSIDEHPHRHDFHEFLYIKNGSGRQEVDGVTYHLNANTFYIISKGQVHNFLVAKELEGTLIRFKDSILPAVQSLNEGYYHNLLFALSQQNSIAIKSEDTPLIEVLLSRMQKEYDLQSGKVLDLSLIQHLLYPLLILLNRYVEETQNFRDLEQNQYGQFINLLERSFKQYHGLDFYARELGVSKRRLSQICQQKAGKTTKKVINERVLTESKRLMKYTSLPLKEIANRLGFKDLGYFCRYFKRETGITPSGYKEK